MNEQDRIWYNDFAAEWYESMNRYREKCIKEKQEKINREARERYEEEWGFAHGIGPYGSAVFDSFDPCDDLCYSWNGGYYFDLE